MIKLLDLGEQPLSARLLCTESAEEQIFPIGLVQNPETGLIQLENTVPYVELVRQFDWAVYREPEAHLDGVVERFLQYRGGSGRLSVAGLSIKDWSLVERFQQAGHSGWVIDPSEDLQISGNCGVETIQAVLSESIASSIAQVRGKADLVIARHIWEHTYDLQGLSSAVHQLLKDDGLLLVEVPDCEPLITNFDYTMIWEEHSYYFTSGTLLNCLRQAGFFSRLTTKIRSDSEDLILIMADTNHQDTCSVEKFSLPKELENGRSYSRHFEQTKRAWKTCLQEFKEQGPVILFGVGHLSISFVNYLNLGDFIDLAVDDNQHKQGRYLPGSRIQIMPTDEIRRRRPSLVLLGFALDPNMLSRSRWKEMIGIGITVKSIFSSSPLSTPQTVLE